jgi:potassium-transporting ATPase potassium-binding subunit
MRWTEYGAAMLLFSGVSLVVLYLIERVQYWLPWNPLGIANSALFTTVTTDASCGAINNQRDSLTPLAGMVPLVNIMLGEVVFGGVGAGMYGILVFTILAVFLAGLMVGRTPEYLGKKIES